MSLRRLRGQAPWSRDPWEWRFTEPRFDDPPCAQDPELFHSKSEARRAEAKILCRTCPHIQQCLRRALDSRDKHAVMGGTTWPERKKMLQDEAAAESSTGAAA